MGAILWMITILAGLAGAALWTDSSLPYHDMLRWWAIGLAVLACPLIWRKNDGLLSWLPLGGMQRMMAVVAGLFALPAVFF